jgi:hypothetical protein
MFGLTIDFPKKSYWGARALYKNNEVLLLNDRQQYEGDNPHLQEWLNQRALPWLCSEAEKQCLGIDSDEMLILSEFKFELRASPKRSFGYMYIGAVEHLLQDDVPYINTFSNKSIKTVALHDGRRFMVDDQMVDVGTTGKVTFNNIGPATVRGYQDTKKVNDLLSPALLVECHNPPDWLVNQCRDRDRFIWLKERERSGKQIKAWEAKWKMPLLPIHCLDFKPN